MVLLLVVALAISIMAGTFALQNPGHIAVKFLLWEFEGSLALVLLITFALGAFAGLLVYAPAVIRRRLAASEQNRKIAELEQKLEERETSPLQPRQHNFPTER